MEIKETDMRVSGDIQMLQDVEYYKYIFKKTEKVCLAVFYILRSEGGVVHKDTVLEDLENASRTLLATALMSLSVAKTAVDSAARTLRFDLMRLESQLRVAHASRHLSTAHLDVFLRELASLQRTLRTYTERTNLSPLEQADAEPVRERNKPMRAVAAPSASRAHVGTGDKTRRERILEVVRDRGSATIKDITDVVTDCSEKTVQRELIALIKDGIVHREGERRWSKYNLI
jgi:DNA-binding transcriptional ArsR family regulator